MKRVHIGGVFYGCHNIGDEAILFSMLKYFTKMYNISVSTYGSEWIKSEFSTVTIKHINIVYQKPKLGLTGTPRKCIIKNFKLNRIEHNYFHNMDGYICGGATILSDCPWHSLKTVEVAGKAGCHTILWGVGMADGLDNDAKNYIKKILNKPYVDRVYVRDEYVLQRLEDIGVMRDKLRISYDPAIMLLGEEFELKRYLSQKAISMLRNGKKNIAMAISGESDIVGRTPLKVMEQIVKQLVNEKNCNVFLVPTGCGVHCRDREFLRNIAEACNHNCVVAIERELEPQHLVQFLKCCEMALSSRLHLNIFAAAAGVPSIGFVRNSKIVDFANLMELPYFRLEDLRVEDVLRAFDEIEDNYEHHKLVINAHVNRMRKQQTIALEEINKNWL